MKQLKYYSTIVILLLTISCNSQDSSKQKKDEKLEDNNKELFIDNRVNKPIGDARDIVKMDC